MELIHNSFPVGKKIKRHVVLPKIKNNGVTNVVGRNPVIIGTIQLYKEWK